jgi:hypothetical protein
MPRPITARRGLLALLLVLSVHTIAPAQNQSVVLTPANSPRWEATGHVGWYGLHKPNIADWDQWLDAGAGGLSAAFYWTPHVKTEVDFSFAGRGEAYTQESLPFPGPPPATIFRLNKHQCRDAALAAALIYQPLENRWVHPFIGAGLGVVREHARIESTESRYFSGPGPIPPITLAAPPIVTDVSHRVEPQVVGGFKFYVAERAFLRTDLRIGFSQDGASSALWRFGVGVDF